MKKMTKRVMAMVCALVLVAGATLGAISFASDADASPVCTEWSIYSGKEKTFMQNDSGGMEVVVSDAGINLPDNIKKEYLGLQVIVSVPDNAALQSISKGVAELAQNICDVQELNWQLSAYNLKVGENTIVLPLASAGTIDGDAFDIQDTINYFRIYSIENANGSMATLKGVKLVIVRQPGLVFGEEKTKDTYLQLSKPLSEAPQTIEASVKMADDGSAGEKKTEWMIQPGFTVDATNGAVKGYGTHTRDQYEINVSEYGFEELAITFRVYAEKAGVLGSGDNFRLGSKHDLGVAFIHYDYNMIPVEAGWNDIVLPLDQMTNINNGFTLEHINCFGFTTYNLGAGDKRIFEDIMLKVIQPIQDPGSDAKDWALRSGSDANATISGAATTLQTGVTSAADKPGAGEEYFVVDASQAAVNRFGTFNGGLEIDASAYEKNQLAVAFWVYADKAGVLGSGDNFRLSSTDALGNSFLYYDYNRISVEAGWNYITLPLDQWKDLNNGFTLSNIKSFGFTTYNLEAGSVRHFGNMKLIVVAEEKGWMLRPGSSVASDSGHTLGEYTTVSGDEPGAGKNCFVIDATSAKVEGLGTINNDFNYDLSAYEMSDLAVAFWVYAEKAGTFGTGDNFRLGSGQYKGSSFIHYDYNDISVEAGWNYIELPLDTWKNIQNGFTLSKISCFGFTTYNLGAGDKRYIGDIRIVVLDGADNEEEPPQENNKEVKVTVTEDVKTTEKNHMIFSNANAEGEKNTYALFITGDGYPALLYGTTQFTLTKSVRTGDWVDIAVVIDADGYISFYLDGELAAKSTVEVSKALAKPNTKHCIGADGKGQQLMKGSIADVRVWGDERTADEIKNNRIEKKAGTVGNGLDAKTKGLLGSWFLFGNIEYVLETMPDSSASKNTAVFKGSRADDWVEYKIPESIGDDYWAVVLVPDIQNLVVSSEYNMRWLEIAQWIADNVESENIQHVIGEGDSTWDNSHLQYGRAVEGFSKFNSLVATNVIIGNHDYVWDDTGRDSTRYQEYFGENAILQSATANTYVGYYSDPAGKTTTENSYYRFNVNGKKWMILQLEFHPRESVLKWAQGILTKHADDNVIVTTHSYIDGEGNYTTNTNMNYTADDDKVGGSIGDTTEAIWNTYLNKHNNIKLIVCGHSHNWTGSVVTREETNLDGDKVPVLMVNAQDMDAADGADTTNAYYTHEPLGLLGILRFSADGKNVALQYYAPAYGKSFSPQDPGGKADSNNLKYTLDAESCSHKNTTILINDDKVTGTTSGYTGDQYCTDCGEMISNGKVVKPTGKKPSPNKTDTEDGAVDGDKPGESEGAQTSDVMMPIFWISILCVMALVILYMAKNSRKEGKQ